MKLRVLRGERIHQALDEEVSYSQLRGNIDVAFPDTNKRQHATSEVVVSNAQFIPTQGGLQIDTISRSNTHNYKQRLIFTKVNYSPSNETSTGKFMGTDGKEHTIEPISLAGSYIKVSCTCLDFHYRFAVWNFDSDALSGAKPPLYHRKTTTRPPVNPARAPGVCKHIISVVNHLKRQNLLK